MRIRGAGGDGGSGGAGSTINNTFNAELERQINRTLPKGHVYTLGNAGDILQSAGLPDLPIELNAASLKSKSEQENHPFELADMRNLPIVIQEPLAVFGSATQPGTFVILTELRQGDKNYIAAMQGNRRKGAIGFPNSGPIPLKLENHSTNQRKSRLVLQTPVQFRGGWKTLPTMLLI